MEEALDRCPSWMTTVNYCEVLGKLCEKGMPAEQARVAVQDLGLVIIPDNNCPRRRVSGMAWKECNSVL